MKLNPIDASEGRQAVEMLLLDNETVSFASKGGRDMLIFTSRRLISVNVQGLTGKKTEYSSLPYSKIQASSVETAGRFDRDAELEIWFTSIAIKRAPPRQDFLSRRGPVSRNTSSSTNKRHNHRPVNGEMPSRQEPRTLGSRNASGKSPVRAATAEPRRRSDQRMTVPPAGRTRWPAR